MAFLYQRPDSKYFWIRYRDRYGKVCQESTGFRIGVAPEVRQARVLEAQKVLEERSRGEMNGARQDWSWAPEYLKTRYAASAGTMERYLSAWASIRLFL